MKKLIFALLISSLSFSQGSVGIGTTTPQETLDINGSLRIRNLDSTNPDNDGVNIPTVGVDANGTTVLKPSGNHIDSGTFLVTPLSISTGSGFINDQLMHAQTVTTVGPRTLITVCYHTGVTMSRTNGNSITDGAVRLYGSYCTVNGIEIIYSANNYTNNVSNGTILQGYFTTGGTGQIELPAGTYTLNIRAYVGGGSRNTRGDFGYGGSRLTITQQQM